MNTTNQILNEKRLQVRREIKVIIRFPIQLSDTLQIEGLSWKSLKQTSSVYPNPAAMLPQQRETFILQMLQQLAIPNKHPWR